jgi:hypothetical protein
MIKKDVRKNVFCITVLYFNFFFPLVFYVFNCVFFRESEKNQKILSLKGGKTQIFYTELPKFNRKNTKMK